MVYVKVARTTLWYLLAVLIVAGCDVRTDDPANTSSAPVESLIMVEDQFVIVGLDRPRTVRILLPEIYDDSGKNYPVLYMHDGQNLFDPTTSYVGEWGWMRP